MKTQRELLESHRINLDAQWRAKFPRGRFVLQMRGFQKDSKFPVFGTSKKPTVEDSVVTLAWEPRRRTSHSAPCGVCVQDGDFYGGVNGYGVKKSIKIEKYLNNTWGFVKDFADLESLVDYVKKTGVGNDVIECFVKEYDEKHTRFTIGD